MDNELGHIDENLLVKYLTGEATTAESTQLKEWLKVDKNRKEFEGLKLIWEETGEYTPLPHVDVDMAWAKINERIAEPAPEPVVRPLRKFEENTAINWVLRIAAAVIPIIVISLAIWQYNVRNSQMQLVAWVTGDSTEQRTLSDGSVITLAQNSSFSYPKKFGTKSREVNLKGEAFFEVKRNQIKPFIIHTDNAEVKVLGTKFNVNTKLENSATEVVVESGRVAFYIPDKKVKQYVEIERGEKATLNLQAKQINKTEAVEVGFYYNKTKTLVFDKTEMSKVIEVLNSVYGVHIQLVNRDIAQCRLTATFQNQDIDAILGVIADTFSLEIRQTNHGPVIEGSGCELEEEG